jgi:hypothetical protein
MKITPRMVRVLTLGDIPLTARTLCSNCQGQEGADSQVIEGEAMDRYKWLTEIDGVLGFPSCFCTRPVQSKMEQKGILTLVV